MGRSSALLSFLLLASPLLVGFVAVVVLSFSARAAALAAFALSAVGFVTLIFAKLPAFRAGRLWSFGPRTLPSGSRRLWWLAYFFFVAAAPFAAASFVRI